MLKYTGLLLIFLTPVIYGYRRAQKYKSELSFLKSAYDFSKHLYSSVEYMNMSTEEIVNSFRCENPDFSEVLSLLSKSSYGQAYLDDLCPPGDARSAIEEMLSKTGKVSKEELCSIARGCSAALECEYEAKKIVTAQKYKSNLVFGIASGAMLVILFI